MLLRALILVLCLFVAAPVSDAAEQTLGQALKKIFATPTPTPHRKKKTTAATARKVLVEKSRGKEYGFI